MTDPTPAAGHDPSALSDAELVSELESIHRTRHETFLHGSDDALVMHGRRMTALETEYLKRHPRRLVTAGRTRSGARARECPRDT